MLLWKTYLFGDLLDPAYNTTKAYICEQQINNTTKKHACVTKHAYWNNNPCKTHSACTEQNLKSENQKQKPKSTKQKLNRKNQNRKNQNRIIIAENKHGNFKYLSIKKTKPRPDMENTKKKVRKEMEKAKWRRKKAKHNE